MADILDVYSELKIGDLAAAFIGKGNLWVNNTYDKSVGNLTKYIILEAVKNTAPRQLSVVGYDSDLSGIFAPFASLSTGEVKALELLSDMKEFESYLDVLWQQIQSVQNVVQDRVPSLLEFRKQNQRPVESYRLVVISLDMGLIDNKTRSKLSMLMRKGPENGVSFLIVSTTYMTIKAAGGKEIELSVGAIAPNITVLETDGFQVTNIRTRKTVQMPMIQSAAIIEECSRILDRAKIAQLPTIRYDELHDMQKYWTERSVDGLTFSVGMYGINSMEITIGDEINQRHNAIITGAVGQGKSNLISMIIHSLCHRYSPRELQMYLLDFKEGVTFKAFSNIGQEEYLPHARALGLESDPSFGLAVLQSLYKEYLRRMKILKNYNLKSIRELRMQDPDLYMPRIVVVIDEFQMMFGSSEQIGSRIADLLEKSVRLFRAAGIHFILASQTLSDSSNPVLARKKDSLFSQVPIRIALKNSWDESIQTLGLNNTAAVYLRPREAIVNLDYGEITQNRKTVIAYADEKLLKPLRRVWWELAHEEFGAPYVFESEKRVQILNSAKTIQEKFKMKKYPYACLGEAISIDGEPVSVPMSREFGRNIAIIGTPDSECNNAYGIMQGIAVSLALQHRNEKARYIFCDFNSDNEPYETQFPKFTKYMHEKECALEVVDASGFRALLDELLRNPDGGQSVYLFGSCMDRWEYEKDPYGQGSPLKTFVETAPALGVHFIGWWQKASKFNAQVSGYGNSDAFNTKVFLRVDERTVQSLTSPFVRWTSQENRALISDSIELAEEMTFIPYAPMDL